jgi:hypothetical protein
LATDLFAPHNKKNDSNEPVFDGERVTVNPEGYAIPARSMVLGKFIPFQSDGNAALIKPASAKALALATDLFAPHNKKNDSNEPVFDGERVTVNPEVGVAIPARSMVLGKFIPFQSDGNAALIKPASAKALSATPTSGLTVTRFAGQDRFEYTSVLNVYEALATDLFAPHNKKNDSNDRVD